MTTCPHAGEDHLAEKDKWAQNSTLAAAHLRLRAPASSSPQLGLLLLSAKQAISRM